MNILIIGAAGGIGSQLLSDLSKDSSHNILVGFHKKKTETTHNSMEIDASKFEDVESFVSEGLKQFGNIHAVVNLPGNLILKPAHLCDEDEFYKTIDINLKSSFAVVRSVGRLLSNCSVVLMSTAAVSIGLSNHELISSAKAGVEGLAKSAAKTYSRKNIRVNTVSPGLIDTPMFSQEGADRKAFIDSVTASHSIKRAGKPEEVAKGIIFVIENDFVTGTIVDVDGGWINS